MSSGERSEWRAGWAIILCVTLAMAISSVPFFSMGIFMRPVTSEFGWSRTQFTSASVITNTTSCLFIPWLGGLADRWGARPIALTGCLVACGGFASLGLLNGTLWQYHAIWFLTAAGIACSGGFVWSMGLSSRFQRHRATALALALNGANVAGAITPMLASGLIQRLGWRGAYVCLGVGLLLLCFPIALAVFHDAHSLHRRMGRPREARAREDLPGLQVHEALRTRQFWLFGGGIAATAGGTVGLTVHLVPLLTDQGMAAGRAAEIAGLVSFAAMISGLINGVLLDRLFAPYVAAAIFALPMGACLFLNYGSGRDMGGIVAALILGITSAALVNTMSYMTIRYFGLRRYGLLYGLFYSMFSLAQGVVTFLLSIVHDRAGSYRLGLTALTISFGLSALAMLFLGRYPDFSNAPEEPPQAPLPIGGLNSVGMS